MKKLLIPALGLLLTTALPFASATPKSSKPHKIQTTKLKIIRAGQDQSGMRYLLSLISGREIAFDVIDNLPQGQQVSLDIQKGLGIHSLPDPSTVNVTFIPEHVSIKNGATVDNFIVGVEVPNASPIIFLKKSRLLSLDSTVYQHGLEGTLDLWATVAFMSGCNRVEPGVCLEAYNHLEAVAKEPSNSVRWNPKLPLQKRQALQHVAESRIAQLAQHSGPAQQRARLYLATVATPKPTPTTN